MYKRIHKPTEDWHAQDAVEKPVHPWAWKFSKIAARKRAQKGKPDGKDRPQQQERRG